MLLKSRKIVFISYILIETITDNYSFGSFAFHQSTFQSKLLSKKFPMLFDHVSKNFQNKFVFD